MTTIDPRGPRRLIALSVLGAAFLAVALPAAAQSDVVVGAFEPRPADDADLVPGVWYDWFTRVGGAAAIVDLTGAGGNLELMQPLPSGAALLTTEYDNQDRANVGLFDPLGSPGDVFPTLEISYEFLKGSNPDSRHNRNAAPSLKMEIFNPDCMSGCFGTLIYEPYVNGFGNFPETDVWKQADITPDSGGFWWTGGFGVPGSAAGPPYRTLNQWLAVMPPEFHAATIVTVQVGVGSYNQGQIGYFDEVALRHGFGDGLDVVYDFQSVRTIRIDVRPGTDANNVNTNARQLVPIAILGEVDFDPTSEVDHLSVRVRGAVASSTKSDEGDVDGDGIADLTLYFRARAMAKPSAAECSDPDAKLELTGVTLTGNPFVGVDFVQWQGPDCN